MALWDPEAAGNAAKYLRLDDITLIDIRYVELYRKLHF